MKSLLLAVIVSVSCGSFAGNYQISEEEYEFLCSFSVEVEKHVGTLNPRPEKLDWDLSKCLNGISFADFTQMAGFYLDMREYIFEFEKLVPNHQLGARLERAKKIAESLTKNY